MIAAELLIEGTNLEIQESLLLTTCNKEFKPSIPKKINPPLAPLGEGKGEGNCRDKFALTSILSHRERKERRK
jgi:hypothetical protein